MLVNEYVPSAAEARGLHKGRHRPMTAERRLPSMHTVQWAARQTDEAVRRWHRDGLEDPLPKKKIARAYCMPATRTKREHNTNCRRRESHTWTRTGGPAMDAAGSADRTRVQKPRNEKTREKTSRDTNSKKEDPKKNPSTRRSKRK